MDDDLGTPAALAAVHNTVRDGFTALDAGDEAAARTAAATVRAQLGVLGLDPLGVVVVHSGQLGHEALDVLVGELLEQRQQARGDAGLRRGRLDPGPAAGRGDHRRGHPRRSTVDI